MPSVPASSVVDAPRARPRRRRPLLAALLLGALTGSAPGTAAAQAIMLEPVVAGLANPTAVAHAGDDSNRLFVTLQAGRIVILAGGQLLATPFLDITTLVDAGGERGLLGLVFHPRYEQNGLFFVFYTDTAGSLVVSRYSVSADPNVADPGSAAVLLTIPHPGASNHNGGQLQFGPDGYLYIATGDGGGGGDPSNNAQRLDTLLGKLLRVDVDGGAPYAIPPGNPFVGVAGRRPEIWAYGLRNPWRFGFDRLTGDLLVADVGQGSWEEVNVQPAGSPGGQNYGWRLMEGLHCFNPSSSCNDGTLTLPVLEYGHVGGNCSITGGYRYRGAASPALQGIYFYGDLCSGRIWGASRNADGTWSTTELLDTTLTISTFGEDEAGEVYVAHFAAAGVLYRIRSAPAVAGIGVYRSTTGEWFLRGDDGAPSGFVWGAPALGDVPVPADYDGDGARDVAVYRRSTGQWFILRSSDAALRVIAWGAPFTDQPVPADYDGDGHADLAIYRPPSGEWFILRSSDGGLVHLAWGSAFADTPMPADYDGDHHADIAVHRRSTGQWFILRSSDAALRVIAWGAPFTDQPVPADYDGDGHADLAIYRPPTGEWFVLRSSDGGLVHLTWGSLAFGDLAVPFDYDTDGKADIAVFRGATGEWFIQRSSDGSLSVVVWGAPGLGDTPLTRPLSLP